MMKNTLIRLLTLCASISMMMPAYAITSFIPPLQSSKASSSSNNAAPPKTKTLNEYWGIDYNLAFVESYGLALPRPKILSLKLGHHINDSLAFEANMTIQSSHDTVSWNGSTASQSINNILQLRLRKSFVNYQGIEAYGLLGLAYADIDAGIISSNALKQVNRKSFDIAYGVGARTRLGFTNMTGHVEYSRLLNESQFSYSSLSVGIDYYY